MKDVTYTDILLTKVTILFPIAGINIETNTPMIIKKKSNAPVIPTPLAISFLVFSFKLVLSSSLSVGFSTKSFTGIRR